MYGPMVGYYCGPWERFAMGGHGEKGPYRGSSEYGPMAISSHGPYRKLQNIPKKQTDENINKINVKKIGNE